MEMAMSAYTARNCRRRLSLRRLSNDRKQAVFAQAGHNRWCPAHLRPEHRAAYAINSALGQTLSEYDAR
jgi:hypothetical protein